MFEVFPILRKTHENRELLNENFIFKCCREGSGEGFFFCFVIALKQTGNRKMFELDWILKLL